MSRSHIYFNTGNRITGEVKMTTADEFRSQILDKASEDDDFRTQLLGNPTAAISAELDIAMPNGLTVEVHEDTQSVVHLVLPPKVQLDAGELEQATGGVTPADPNEQIGSGW